MTQLIFVGICLWVLVPIFAIWECKRDGSGDADSERFTPGFIAFICFIGGAICIGSCWK